jgi:hypothetical protein
MFGVGTTAGTVETGVVVIAIRGAPPHPQRRTMAEIAERVAKCFMDFLLTHDMS